MTRLLVHVEGETEETFVNESLRSHLVGGGYHSVEARLLGNARARSRRGGIKSWEVVKGDIVRHLAGDPTCLATTMVDYYALPDTWPGRAAARQLAHPMKATHVQAALSADLGAHSPFGQRFEPYVLMHEFEALLFSDCEAFARAIGKPSLEPHLQAVVDAFSGPEEINDSPHTAPSKRVAAIIPGYQKPIFGNIAAIEIGIAAMRAECPNFDDWLERLEARIPH